MRVLSRALTLSVLLTFANKIKQTIEKLYRNIIRMRVHTYVCARRLVATTSEYILPRVYRYILVFIFVPPFFRDHEQTQAKPHGVLLEYARHH